MAGSDAEDKLTSEQVPLPPNPTGKGGFADHPEHINAGGRPKNQESFTYWYNFFKSMTVSSMKDWEKDNPENVRTVAASLAYARILKARNDLKEFQEVADRTEGKPRQSVSHTFGDPINEILDKYGLNANDGQNPPAESGSPQDPASN